MCKRILASLLAAIMIANTIPETGYAAEVSVEMEQYQQVSGNDAIQEQPDTENQDKESAENPEDTTLEGTEEQEAFPVTDEETGYSYLLNKEEGTALLTGISQITQQEFPGCYVVPVTYIHENQEYVVTGLGEALFERADIV